jgi:hypothetical protein
MAAYFPESVRPFQAKIDLVNVVIADHVNALQEEVAAIATALGVDTTTAQSPLYSGFSGTFTTTMNATSKWATLGDRLKNIEAGLVSGVTSAPYVSKNGGSVVTTASNTALTLKTGSGTLALLETLTSSNVLGFNVDYLGIPKVGTANVLYVGSTDYNTLVSATSTASSSASTRIPLSTVTTAGDLIVGTGNATVGRIGIGTNGQSLLSNGTTAVWGTPTDTSKIPLSTVSVAGDLIVATGASSVTRLPIGTAGQVLTSNGTTTTWATPSSAFVSTTNGTVTTASVSSAVVRNIHATTGATPATSIDGDIWVVYA